MGKLDNKIAVITGAGKGIGKAIAKRFLQDGVAGLAILEMDAELGEKTAKEFDPSGEKVISVQCDVSKQEIVHEAFKKVYEKFGKVDILVNNAGITRDAMFHKMSIEQAKLVMDVHFYGTFYCCQEVVGAMREQGYGKIVNISSVSALGNIGQSNYTAAKSAIEGLTRTLAMECGRKNITVNCIAPGMIDTDILKTIPEDILKAKINSVPMQRLGDPSEVASVASFLASDDSSWVTGNVILCCGGQKIKA